MLTSIYLGQEFVVNVQLCFITPSPEPRFEGFFSGKRIKTNRQPFAIQGFSGLSLLYRKGTPLRHWRSKTAWTSRPCPVCWATTQQASRWTHIHMLPLRQRKKRQTRWAISSPVLSSSFRMFPRMGHSLGLDADPQFEQRTIPKKNEERS